jgi:hypothetical protein
LSQTKQLIGLAKPNLFPTVIDAPQKGREARRAQALEGPMFRELQLVAVGLVFAFLGAIVIGVI